MAILIRIAAVLGALWSTMILGLMATVGGLVSFFGLYDRTNSNEFVCNTINLEIILLFALWQAGQLRLRAAAFLLVWFVAFSAHVQMPFVLHEWPQVLWGSMVYLWPVTLTMLLLTLQGIVGYFKARQDRAPQVPPLPQAL